MIGIAEFGATLLMLLWMIKEWKTTGSYWLIIAAGCFIKPIVIFFMFTFSANKLTQNWTYAPSDWKTVRAHWEYSHAIRAVLHFTGFFF
jgi:hypothetical protein